MQRVVAFTDTISCYYFKILDKLIDCIDNIVPKKLHTKQMVKVNFVFFYNTNQINMQMAM